MEVFGSLSHLLASCKPGSGCALLFRCCLQATFVQRNWNESESGPFKDLIFHQTAQRRTHTKKECWDGGERIGVGGGGGREMAVVVPCSAHFRRHKLQRRTEWRLHVASSKRLGCSHGKREPCHLPAKAQKTRLD